MQQPRTALHLIREIETFYNTQASTASRSATATSCKGKYSKPPSFKFIDLSTRLLDHTNPTTLHLLSLIVTNAHRIHSKYGTCPRNISLHCPLTHRTASILNCQDWKSSKHRAPNNACITCRAQTSNSQSRRTPDPRQKKPEFDHSGSNLVVKTTRRNLKPVRKQKEHSPAQGAAVPAINVHKKEEQKTPHCQLALTDRHQKTVHIPNVASTSQVPFQCKLQDRSRTKQASTQQAAHHQPAFAAHHLGPERSTNDIPGDQDWPHHKPHCVRKHRQKEVQQAVQQLTAEGESQQEGVSSTNNISTLKNLLATNPKVSALTQP